MSFEDAFARHDFTMMNAIGWDVATEELVDPIGGRAEEAPES